MKQRKDKRHTACSEEKKRKISETLSGQKFGGDFKIVPEDGAELRSSIAEGDHFRYQKVIDWYRDVKGL